MVKCTPRSMRSAQREIAKLRLELSQKKERHDASNMLQPSSLQKSLQITERNLALEKETSDILRKSLKNFSLPLYKLRHKYKNIVREMAKLSRENDHMKRGIVQLNEIRKKKKRRTQKTHYRASIDI